ncbi:alcohol acetyltransferase [Favolaschia claudopus]|uniref:Alcohol acetyltransferase n=1 Tax=Favolaschia claudopus TaxID=2862362 RepID=A0AAW0BFF5_9AGAR
MSSPTVVRPTGLMESFHATRHFLGIDSCIMISARFISTGGSTLGKELLFPALHKVIHDLPILAVMIKDESFKPSFVKLDTIDLSAIVEFSNETDLETIFERQLSVRLDTTAPLPLWRLQVLKDGTVLFVFHHCIGDALSGAIFHKTLLAALQEPVVGADSALVVVPKTISLLPPLEEVTDVRPSLLNILTTALALFIPIPASWKRSYYAWTANPVSKTPDFTPHAKVMTFNAEEMDAFLKVCRTHNATITSAFYTLTAAIMSKLVPPHSPSYRTIGALVAISMRSIAGTPDGICNYVSGHYTYPPINPAFQWPAAAAYAQELQRQKTVARETVGLIYYLFGNIAPFFQNSMGNKRNAAFEISNVGRIPDPTAHGLGPWRIDRMVFAQSDLVVNAALKVNVIGDPTGAVHVTLTWGEAAIDRNLVDSFAVQFQEGVRSLIS